jgi:hypothetical protein
MDIMTKARSLRKGFGLLIVFGGLILLLGAGAQGVLVPENGGEARRADLIVIDTLKSFGDLERPPVPFMHDRHTRALEKLNQDCSTCHPSKDGRLSPKFGRLEDTGKKAVMDVYHQGCIECHKQTKVEKRASGPVTCGDCHKASIPLTSNRRPFGMDKSLHYRHSKSLDNQCEQCHHEYNEKEKKLVYVKGTEGTCRYCHQDVTRENRISMKLASHRQCIDCHRDRVEKNLTAGPVQCGGCHSPQAQDAIEVVRDVPRMERGQPDVVFVKQVAGNRVESPDRPPLMDRVPFDHKKHEAANDSCRVCHHADLKTCAGCHTVTGSEKGQHVKLARAMHQQDAGQSCIGCHAEKQKQPQCAGCHASIERPQQNNTGACKTCHMQPGDAVADESPESGLNLQAAMLLQSERRENIHSLPDADIPETVRIDSLSDQYQGAEMPHRKIVRALEAKIGDSKLADYFHTEATTLCQGCHHQSPPATKPPKCGSCHGQPFNNEKLMQPGLVAAYHQQCMSCHEQMQMTHPAATDCTACHQKK